MSAKKWFFMFVFSVCLVVFLYALFNVLVDPFGVFGDKIFNWYSYNMTNNPRAAKIAYLDEHYKEYDSYIIGCSSTSSFPVESFNKYFNAKAYNLIMYGADMLDVEQTCEYIIDNYDVKNIVLNVFISNATKYNYEEDKITKNLHAKVNDENLFKFYLRYMFLNPDYSLAKIKSWKNDTYLTQIFDVFNEKTGAYDKKVRDVEPVGNMDFYLDSYPVFRNYPSGLEDMDEINTTVASLQRISNFCEDKGVNLIVVSAPAYYDYMKYFPEDMVREFYTKIAQITSFWDFSLSSVSKEPRYFYDETHFRNSVGDMAFARIADATDAYVPEDFGVYVTSENVAEHLENFFEVESDVDNYSAEVPIITYHHITDEADEASEVTLEKFESDIKYLSENDFNFILFDDLVKYVYEGIDLPEKPILVTFDDGYLSNYEFAFPILKKYSAKATIFIIGSTVGNVEHYKDTSFPITPHFNLEQAKEMVDSGLVSIQSHTYDMHQWAPYEDSDVVRENLLRLDFEDEYQYLDVVKADMEKSKKQIESLGEEFIALAYPSGMFDTLTNVALVESGIKAMVSIDEGINTVIKGLPQSLYALKRFNIDMNRNIEDIL